MRALWLRSSLKNPIVTQTPLGLLNGFFSLPMLYPQRQQISLTITLADPQTYMVVKDGANGIQYKLVPITSKLRCKYAILLPSLREKW